MNLTDIALNRYSTKAFDPDKKIPSEQFDQIKSLLRFSPSSVNSQPWHFIIAHSDEGKARFMAGAQGRYEFNGQKIHNASHVILFCAKTDIDDNYLEALLALEDQDGRFTDPSFKDMVHAGRSFFVNMHRFDLKDAQHWMEKQVYLNMGTVLLGAGAMGIDAVPIEGMDMSALNQEFGLTAKGYTAVAAVALGYRDENDFNAALPKSRRSEDDIFTELA
ncbi:oxygen-insensitive NAD(P)H nitroreductase [Thaumasiovibrio subtropicus]|uniref:oxygen-insensitive NAD(P)H nitroreductase n=1 Tax=Thaumasiovibrio subtropicus TaxID=1891207 RepID=UPI000B351C28|nr:oxygen-insensitive NAD(P)H nitroreductase [Thaumasiovibrio subtropicus]